MRTLPLFIGVFGAFGCKQEATKPPHAPNVPMVVAAKSTPEANDAAWDNATFDALVARASACPLSSEVNFASGCAALDEWEKFTPSSSKAYVAATLGLLSNPSLGARLLVVEALSSPGRPAEAVRALYDGAFERRVALWAASRTEGNPRVLSAIAHLLAWHAEKEPKAIAELVLMHRSHPNADFRNALLSDLVTNQTVLWRYEADHVRDMVLESLRLDPALSVQESAAFLVEHLSSTQRVTVCQRLVAEHSETLKSRPRIVAMSRSCSELRAETLAVMEAKCGQWPQDHLLVCENSLPSLCKDAALVPRSLALMERLTLRNLTDGPFSFFNGMIECEKKRGSALVMKYMRHPNAAVAQAARYALNGPEPIDFIGRAE